MDRFLIPSAWCSSTSRTRIFAKKSLENNGLRKKTRTIVAVWWRTLGDHYSVFGAKRLTSIHDAVKIPLLDSAVCPTQRQPASNGSSAPRIRRVFDPDR